MGRVSSRFARKTRYLNLDPFSVSIVAVTDPQRMPDPSDALSSLPRGSALIWRAYENAPSAKRVRSLDAAARAKSCILLIAGSPKLARRLGVPGIHLPERDLAHYRGFAFGQKVVTASCHSERAIIAAARAGVDAILLSPVMPTESHPGGKTLGITRFARLVRLANELGLSVYALGGISTPASVARLRGTGAAGVAGIGFLLERGS